MKDINVQIMTSIHHVTVSDMLYDIFGRFDTDNYLGRLFCFKTKKV